MDWVYLIGRALFGLIFVGSGVGHFVQLPGMARYADSKKVPAAKATVAVTGLMLLAGGLSVILGVYMEIGLWLLVFFLLSAAFTMHDFWTVNDPMQKMVEQAMFMKNLSMAGAALILYWVIRTYGYGPMSLGHPMGG
ncbi:MAG: DoxX family protein [Gemmatimonadota bacterium]|nr:MAG: DoxX family protein [Gemmatimonadota bacterium]